MLNYDDSDASNAALMLRLTFNVSSASVYNKHKKMMKFHLASSSFVFSTNWLIRQHAKVTW